MTIGEAIDKLDRLKPNQYEQGDKIKWLSDLDGQLMNTVFNQCEGEVSYSPYTNDDTGKELLVPSPYDELYINFMAYKVDYFNGEYERFNNTAILYNTQLQDFMAYWFREHKPLQKNRVDMR